jgi:hypothetical protein
MREKRERERDERDERERSRTSPEKYPKVEKERQKCLGFTKTTKNPKL